MPRAGDLRDRALIEFPIEGSRDADGKASVAWSALARTWANLRETPGREAIAAGRLEAKVTGTMRVRSNVATKRITPGCRVTVRGHVWSVVSEPVDVGGRDRLIEVILQRGGAPD
jgi:head-tail adaptor